MLHPLNPSRSVRAPARAPLGRLRPGRLAAVVLAVSLLAPTAALATLLSGPGDPALAGALVQDFDGEAVGYFSTRSFLIGADGFDVTALANDIHLDATWCDDFGTSGGCLDTLSSGGGANDDFDVVFTGSGVSAFGFALNALDTDWTIETYDASDNLLGSYVVASQSPGLSGFARRGWFGATESVPIQSFTVRSAGNDRALIDDFAYVPVPQPGTGLLAGLGLIGLASVGRTPRASGHRRAPASRD